MHGLLQKLSSMEGLLQETVTDTNTGIGTGWEQPSSSPPHQPSSERAEWERQEVRRQQLRQQEFKALRQKQDEVLDVERRACILLWRQCVTVTHSEPYQGQGLPLLQEYPTCDLFAILELDLPEREYTYEDLLLSVEDFRRRWGRKPTCGTNEYGYLADDKEMVLKMMVRMLVNEEMLRVYQGIVMEREW